MTIQTSRIQPLNSLDIRHGKYILYWMQQSQRSEYNHALEYAIELANRYDAPVLAVFGLASDYPEANLRHYTFMLEGLRETQESLKKRGIQLSVQWGNPPDVAIAASKNASVIVCDRGYLRHQKAWRQQVAQLATCRVVQVESDVIVPVEVTSTKAEYAARTIRPKIHRQLKDYRVEVPPATPKKSSLEINMPGIDLQDLNAVLKPMNLETVPPVSQFFKGGTQQAKQRFNGFLQNRLALYSKHYNQPQTDDISHMSPYLHFGQISALYLALEIWKLQDAPDAKDAYLEELIVRRELAVNFVHYTPNYDSYDCLPVWAKSSLQQHELDRREPIYSSPELENAQTNDPYWNAAMNEMKYTGFMHNYMRMYWGKKILEWSPSPAIAYRTLVSLNNKYFLDGRDPNSYAGAAWIFGLHDRAWKERPIFGKIRYMAASGLERKCDIKAYVEKTLFK